MSAPDNAPPWYSQGLAFACARCGRCCSGDPGYVWVSLQECDRIAHHLGISLDTFAKQHLRRVGLRLSLRELPGGDCEFLLRSADGLTACAVHPVRPIQCRTWPFWKSNVRSPRAWNAAAAACPGIGCGPTHPPAVIEAALRANGNLPL